MATLIQLHYGCTIYSMYTCSLIYVLQMYYTCHVCVSQLEYYTVQLVL